MRLTAQARSRPGNAKDARCGITLFFSNRRYGNDR